MITFPNAKINIGLRVTEKRADNYHNIETIFYPIALKDALEVAPLNPPEGGKLLAHVSTALNDRSTALNDRTSPYSVGLGGTFNSSGIAVDTPPENNLIVKAYRLLAKDFPLPAVDVHLHKQIPFGAGLGGGSADAAFMLKMLNEMFSLEIPTGKLEQYASMLGADCAFFVRSASASPTNRKPVLATGIGNVFQDIDLDLSKYHIAIVKPPVFVSTAQAYAAVKPRFDYAQRPEALGDRSRITLAEIVKKPISEWKNHLFNDFEQSVFAQFPAIAGVKNELYNRAALYASMSGSGSAVYGIFEEKPKLEGVFPSDYFWHTDDAD